MTQAVERIEGVLEAFMADALADDYAHLDGRAESVDRRPAVSRGAAVLVAALIGVILAAALVATVQSAGSRQQTKAALAERVTAAQSAVAGLQADVDEQSVRVRDSQARLLRDSDAAPGIAAAVSATTAQAGGAPLSGAGVTVTVDDAADAKSGSLNRVLDRDLQDVVNALWQEGAVGVAVNGHRVLSTTAIRSAGDAIVVNYEPLTRPYRVEAVGATQAAAPTSGLHGLLDHLARDYGLVSSINAGDVALPAGEWHEPRYAKPAEAVQGGSS